MACNVLIVVGDASTGSGDGAGEGVGDRDREERRLDPGLRKIVRVGDDPREG